MRDARSAFAIAALLLAVVGCSAGQPSAQPGSAQPSALSSASEQPLVPATPSAVPPTVPAAFADPDPALVTHLMADGATEGEAIFLALTQTTAEQLAPLSYRIVHLFPTGNTAEITVTVTRDVVRDPDASAPMEATYTETDGDLGFRLEYFIPYDEMPDDVEQEITAASAAAAGALALAGHAFAPVAAEKSGAVVVAQGVVKAFNDSQLSSFLKYAEQRLGTAAEFDNLYKAIKKLLSVKDALALQEEFEGIDTEINKLKKCAENPTNPITRNGYRDDPGQRQRILDQVEATRNEIKSNTAVMFFALANATFSSHLGTVTKVKWLSFVVGPATAWSKQTLQELNQKLLDELKKLITKCDDYRIDKTVTGSEGGGFVTYTIQYTGTKCGGPAGEWTIDSAGTLTGGGDSAQIGGPITVQIDESSGSGPLLGTANFTDVDAGEVTTTQGVFTGTGTFDEQGQKLVLEVTGGSGNGYTYGFLDTGLSQPGTLTFPLEAGDFCD